MNDDINEAMRSAQKPLREATVDELIDALFLLVPSAVVATLEPADDLGDYQSCRYQGAAVTAWGLTSYAQEYLRRVAFGETG